MTNSFSSYTEASLNALIHNPRKHEIIQKKKEILSSIEQHALVKPETILFYGFSAMILSTTNKEVFVTNITESIKKYLDQSDIKYTYITDENIIENQPVFDWVIAGDEYFTFANSEDHQRGLIERLSALAGKMIITTLRDYKNQDFKDKEFSQPLAVRNDSVNKIFLEHHDYDYTDKISWVTNVYEIQGSDMTIYGPFNRRAMFFKQMAKFSIDCGAKSFFVHKNLMYKSLIKKNYEHVISISF